MYKAHGQGGNVYNKEDDTAPDCVSINHGAPLRPEVAPARAAKPSREPAAVSKAGSKSKFGMRDSDGSAKGAPQQCCGLVCTGRFLQVKLSV